MENIFILSSRSQLIDSMRRSLVYANTLGLSFRFFEDVASMLAEITMNYKPKMILVDQNGTVFNLPTSLQSIVFKLVEHPSQHEKEVSIYQNINGFVDDVIALSGNNVARPMARVDRPLCIWLLDPEEKEDRQEIMEIVIRSAKRKGVKSVIADCSRWGDALKSSEINQSKSLSDLMDLYSRGQYHAYFDKAEMEDIVTGMDHPMDCLYLTQAFLEEILENRAIQKSHIFIYSGFLESSAMIYLTSQSHQVWYFESSRVNQSRVIKNDKVVNWIQSSNKKVQIERIKSDGNEQLRIESLIKNLW